MGGEGGDKGRGVFLRNKCRTVCWLQRLYIIKLRRRTIINNTDVNLDLTLDVVCYGVTTTSTKDGVTSTSTKDNKNKLKFRFGH